MGLAIDAGAWPDRMFDVIAYAKGHGQLLLGSGRFNGSAVAHETRIHLLFKLVHGINLPTHMRGLELSVAPPDVAEPILASTLTYADSMARVYSASGQTWVGWIVAGVAYLAEDTKRSLTASSEVTGSIWWQDESGSSRSYLKAIRRSPNEREPSITTSIAWQIGRLRRSNSFRAVGFAGSTDWLRSSTRSRPEAYRKVAICSPTSAIGSLFRSAQLSSGLFGRRRIRIRTGDGGGLKHAPDDGTNPAA